MDQLRIFAGEATRRGQAGNFQVVLIDGVLGGLWHHRRSGRRVAITVELFRPLTTAPRGQLESQAERIADVLRAEPALLFGPMRSRTHVSDAGAAAGGTLCVCGAE